MNLTNTKRWNESAHWYACNKHHYTMFLVRPINCPDEQDFINLPFEFQEGVYKKFIESQSFELSSLKGVYTISRQDIKHRENTFQELVEWFFNNE